MLCSEHAVDGSIVYLCANQPCSTSSTTSLRSHSESGRSRHPLRSYVLSGAASTIPGDGWPPLHCGRVDSRAERVEPHGRHELGSAGGGRQQGAVCMGLRFTGDWRSPSSWKARSWTSRARLDASEWNRETSPFQRGVPRVGRRAGRDHGRRERQYYCMQRAPAQGSHVCRGKRQFSKFRPALNVLLETVCRPLRSLAYDYFPENPSSARAVGEYGLFDHATPRLQIRSDASRRSGLAKKRPEPKWRRVRPRRLAR